jgi:NadR type nicotinamide-nucleotide adenylyltransferase
METFRVVLTGSESTGKTTLARELAGHYGIVTCGEFVREYLDRRGGVLDAGDVEPIARGQIALEDAHVRTAAGLVIHDTDLISTVAYARHYYGGCPEWIVEAARARRAALYLLMDIDVPWIPDAQRDRGHLREEIHALFVATLAELGAESVVVRGTWEERRRRAIDAIEALYAAR